MRVLLVNTNTYRSMSPMPLGLAFIAAALKKRGHSVAVTDLMFAPDPKARLRRELAGLRPDVAGFSIRNLDNQNMGDPVSLLPQIKQLVGLAKEAGVPAVLGGTAFTTLPEAMLSFMDADYGIAGQGEVGLPRLVESIASGSVDEDIPGLVWRKDGAIRCNPPCITGYRNVSGDWDLLSIKGYRNSMMPAAVLVKTGCPYECSYCDVYRTFGKRFYIREPEEIVDDIRRMRRTFRIASFFLVDPCLNAPLSQAKEILQAIVRAQLGVNIQAMLDPVHGEYDDELLSLYRRAGGAFAVLGAESCSDTMLRSYKKPFDMQDVMALAAMAHRHGIRFVVDLMFGGPGETEATLKDGLLALEKIPFSFSQWALGVRILPGTALFETAKSEGVVSDVAQLFSPAFYLSAQLDRARAAAMIHKAMRRYSYRHIRMLPIGLRGLLARYLNVAI